MASVHIHTLGDTRRIIPHHCPPSPGDEHTNPTAKTAHLRAQNNARRHKSVTPLSAASPPKICDAARYKFMTPQPAPSASSIRDLPGALSRQSNLPLNRGESPLAAIHNLSPSWANWQVSNLKLTPGIEPDRRAPLARQEVLDRVHHLDSSVPPWQQRLYEFEVMF